MIGDAADPAVTERAAALAEPLRGWVNNAAVFRDAWLRRSRRRRGDRPDRGQPQPGDRGMRDGDPGIPARRTARRHRQRLLPPGAAAGTRLAPVCHGEGGDRRTHPRAGGRLRAARDPGQRGGAGLDRDRTLRRASRGAGCGSGGALRRRDPAAAAAGPDGARRGGGRRGRVPAVRPGVASSTARSCRSTAAGPPSAATPRNATDRAARPRYATAARQRTSDNLRRMPQPLESPQVIRDRAVSVADYLLAVRAHMERPARTVPGRRALAGRPARPPGLPGRAGRRRHLLVAGRPARPAATGQRPGRAAPAAHRGHRDRRARPATTCWRAGRTSSGGRGRA